MSIYTIGHSTRSIEDFLETLKSYNIEILLDIRTVPKSKHNPQFAGLALEAELVKNGVSYIHIPELGGFRHPKKDSKNMEWRNTSFRGYADYMETEEFEKGLKIVEEISKNHTAALMCSEAMPFRCHRALVAGALTVAGWEVIHIMTAKSSNRHSLTPFLKIVDGKLTYPRHD